jgi:GNAT superfamily N-acetyltransferase
MQTTIRPATQADSGIIALIGRLSVEEAHRASCPAEDMHTYLSATYNDEALRAELSDKDNVYQLLLIDGQPAGFSKIIFNVSHPTIPERNATKLDRIYLLHQYYGTGLGYKLMQHNIQLCKEQGQSGMWLFTWVGNKRAVDFYKRIGFHIIGAHRFKVTDTHYNEHHHMMLRF